MAFFSKDRPISNLRRTASARAFGVGLAALVASFAFTAQADAGVILSPGESSMSAAAGDSADQPSASDRSLTAESDLFAVLYGSSGASAPGAGTSGGVSSSTTLAVAQSACELPALQLCGYLTGERKLFAPAAPLFDFLRPPRAA